MAVTVDPSFVSRLVTAIDLLYAPTASIAQRTEANQFCEHLKQDAAASLECVFPLLRNAALDENTRHFALHLLENVVRSHWAALDVSVRESIKAMVLEYLTQETHLIAPQGQRFIKEKFGSIVVDVAKREWPQNWPALIEQLCRIATIGELHAEMMLIVTRGLMEVHDYCQGIYLCAETLAGGVFQLCTIFIGQHTASAEAEARAKLALTTFLSIAELMSYSLIAKGHVIPFLMSLLHSIPLRLIAATGLETLYQRRPGELELLVPTVTEGFYGLQDLASALSISSGSHTDDYTYHKALARALAALGSAFAAALPSIEHLPSSLGLFVELLIQVLAHNSLLLSGSVQTCWNLLVSHSMVSETPAIKDNLERIISVAASNLRSLEYVEDASKVSDVRLEYSLLDFDSKDDFQGHYSLVVGSRMEFVKHLAALAPQKVFGFAEVQFTRLAGAAVQDPQEMTALAVFLKCSVEGVVSKSVDIVELLPHFDRIFAALESLTPTDFVVQEAVLSAFKALSPFYCHRPAYINSVLQRCLSVLQLHLASQQVPSQVVSMRKKACTGLVHIAHNSPQLILAHLEQLVAEVMRLNSGGFVSAMERMLLCEALVEASNAMPQFAERQRFLGFLVRADVDQWCSPATAQPLQGPATFLELAGVLPSTNDTSQQRSQFLEILRSCNGIFKRAAWLPSDVAALQAGGYVTPMGVQTPCTAFLQEMMPNLLELARVLHSLWYPDTRSAVPPEAHGIFDIDEHFIAIVLRQTPDSSSSSIPPAIRSIRTWLFEVRQACYSLLGLATKVVPNMYQLPTLPEMLFSSIFSHLHTTALWHIRLLLLLLEQVFHILHSNWRDMVLRDQAGIGGTGQEQAEMVHDKLLRDVTHEYYEFIKVILRAPGTTKLTAKQPPSTMLHYLCTNEQAMQALLFTLTSTFAWPDSQALASALLLCSHILPVIADNARFYPIVATQLFQAVINAVTSADERLFGDLLSIIQQIYSLPNRDLQRQVLLQIPNTPESAIVAFEQALLGESRLKQQRKLYKQFFGQLQGADTPAVRGKKAASFYALVDSVYRPPKPEGASDLWKDAQSLNIASLWGGSER